MPQVVAEVTVPVEPSIAFAVSQTTGAVRLQWDPFIREQHLMDGATTPAKGVRTSTRSRHGFAMVSEYVSYQPPRNVGMTVRSKPWFFASFGGGWRFSAAPGGGTRAVWAVHVHLPSVVATAYRRAAGRSDTRPRHPAADSVAARASGGPAPT